MYYFHFQSLTCEFLDHFVNSFVVLRSDAQLGKVEGGDEVILEGALVQWREYHTHGGGVVGDGVDEDEGTRLAVVDILIPGSKGRRQ